MDAVSHAPPLHGHEGPYILMFQPLTPVAMRKNVVGYKPGIVEDTYFFRTITKT